MKNRSSVFALLALVLIQVHPAIAQERGDWRPANSNAQSITNEIAFSSDKLTIDEVSFPVAEIRPLNPAEISTIFDGVMSGTGHLYRLSIPANKRFLHKNTLCGSEETQWAATLVSGKMLEIAFFSNPAPPTFTVEKLSDSLCGTYSYVR
jgi:hypothetical protein